MARAPYTPRRRLLMQVVVWLVFAGSIGLAAGVVQWKLARTHVELTAPQTIVGGLELRLPRGWEVRVGRDGVIQVTCMEPTPTGVGRCLIIVSQRVAADTHPLDLLIDRSVERDESADGATDLEGGAERIDIDGAEGVLVEDLRQIRVRGQATPRYEHRARACAILRGGQAVTIEVLGQVGGEAALLRQVAATIHLTQGSGRVHTPPGAI